jgi:hypothetical protein
MGEGGLNFPFVFFSDPSAESGEFTPSPRLEDLLAFSTPDPPAHQLMDATTPTEALLPAPRLPQGSSS